MSILKKLILFQLCGCMLLFMYTVRIANYKISTKPELFKKVNNKVSSQMRLFNIERSKSDNEGSSKNKLYLLKNINKQGMFQNKSPTQVTHDDIQNNINLKAVPEFKSTYTKNVTEHLNYIFFTTTGHLPTESSEIETEETTTVVDSEENVASSEITTTSKTTKDTNSIKYILEWTVPTASTNKLLMDGQQSFIINDCENTNCYITRNKTLVKEIDYSAILFNAARINQVVLLPFQRTQTQKYVFYALEPPSIHHIKNKYLNHFFNWTWTYRLDSTFKLGYINVYDKGNGMSLVPFAPKVNIQWPDLLPLDVDKNMKVALETKAKAVVWLASKCKTRSRRELRVQSLKKELIQQNLTLDVYGDCSETQCGSDWDECISILKKDYYFYLSFEETLSKDYVTADILTPFNNNLVPIVFGEANYTRFLPPYSYLNVNKLGPRTTALIIREAIINSTVYERHFLWKNRFSIVDGLSKDVCNLCNMLNSEEADKISVIYDFNDWWNRPIKGRIVPKTTEK